MKKKQKIKVEFLGKSSSEITQSCYKITADLKIILLDYGLYQTQNLLQCYLTNHKRIKELKPKSIDYIILSHANIDHCGALPYLYKNGCDAPLYVPAGNKELINIMFQDSMKIMESDAIKLSNKYKMNASALYNDRDIDVCLSHVIECDFGYEYSLSDRISFTFLSAHHIINAAQISLEIRDENSIKRIHYTGDIGSPTIPRPYLRPFEFPKYCDLLIGECTYSADTRNHHMRDRDKDIEKIKSIVEQVHEAKGKILFPVFSLDRLQTILTTLYDIYGNDSAFTTKILIDTPLGIKITKLWADILTVDIDKWNEVISWGNICYVDTYEQSVTYQNSSENLIILASSGMCTNGRSVSWIKQLLPNSKNYVCFCGYSAEDSLAARIKNGKNNKTILVEGKCIPNKCNIMMLYSYSSHACQEELLDLYSTLNYNIICLVHSDYSDKCLFANKLKERLSKNNKSAKVVAVCNEYSINI